MWLPLPGHVQVTPCHLLFSLRPGKHGNLIGSASITSLWTEVILIPPGIGEVVIEPDCCKSFSELNYEVHEERT